VADPEQLEAEMIRADKAAVKLLRGSNYLQSCTESLVSCIHRVNEYAYMHMFGHDARLLDDTPVPQTTLQQVAPELMWKH